MYVYSALVAYLSLPPVALRHSSYSQPSDRLKSVIIQLRKKKEGEKERKRKGKKRKGEREGEGRRKEGRKSTEKSWKMVGTQ